MLTLTAKAHWESVVRQTCDALSEHYGVEIPYPDVKWNLRGTSTLGQANAHMIRLHPECAEKVGDAYRQTVVHEACHVATETRRLKTGVARQGRWTAHGSEWQRAMRFMGLKPDRCSSIADSVALTPARKVTKYKVACACRTHEVTAVRLKKLDRLICRSCKSGLKLVG